MDWMQIRNEMPAAKQWAYLDHAAVAPMSGPARRAFSAWIDDMTDNGVVHESRWLRRVEEVRRLAAAMIHAEPDEIAFVKNTSEGIGFVAEGLPWREGDNVVLAAEEYPSNIYPWMNLAGRGVEARLVPSRGPRIDVDDVRQRIDARTRLVSLSYVEFASGFRNDLDAVGALCRERGVLFCVDAIQGMGVLPLDVTRTPIDFLAADGHKWLLGPEGAGVFFVRRGLIEQLRPTSVGWNSVVGAWDFSTIDFTLKPNAGRWENGTLNLGGIAALGASIEMLSALGIETVRDRVRLLTDHLCERARTAGIEVFSSRREGEWSGIVSLILPDAKETARRCRESGFVVSARGGRLRASPHCYNNTDEIDALIGLLTGSNS